jgi:hypothetical protein
MKFLLLIATLFLPSGYFYPLFPQFSFLQMKNIKEDVKIINQQDIIDGRYRILVRS